MIIRKLCAVLLLLAGAFIYSSDAAKRPNVIVVLTDDQGYGQFGFTGNPIVKTPNLDRFAKENIWLDQLYVEPVCTPSRVALLTGRHPYRAGITWVGQQLNKNDLMMGEVFKAEGYRTACFAKWGCIGNNYPLRPMDRGFDESVIHLKGQFGPPQNKTAYFDPILWHNGEEKQYKGYCNDVWFDEAEKFVERNRKKPFFLYLPTNLPHLPAQVPEKYSKPYMGKAKHDQMARSYGMITHIDERFGRLLQKLDDLKIRDNTIVVYLGDNGANWEKDIMYTAGLRGKKAYVYEGGIRQPCLISWPKRWKKPRKINTICSAMDIMPTLLAAVGIKLDKDPAFDGMNLMPMLDGDESACTGRTLITQGYPTAKPQFGRAFMVRNQKYKLVQQVGNKKIEGYPMHPTIPEKLFKYELFDMEADQGEARDLSSEFPEMVKEMRQQYKAWWDDVTQNPGFTRKRTVDSIGYDQQPKVRLLTYGADTVEVASPGPYRITLEPFGIQKWRAGDIWDGTPFVAKAAGSASFKMKKVFHEAKVKAGDKIIVFDKVEIPTGRNTFTVTFDIEGEKVFGRRDEDGNVLGPIHVTFEKL